MKGNGNIKQATVLLMAYVLVVGFVGASGMVDGQDSSASSDITVTAEESGAQISLNGVWEGTDDTGTQVNYTNNGGDFTPGSDIYINATVSTDSGHEYIDKVEVNLTYEGVNNPGEAVVQYLQVILTNQSGDWSNEGYYDATFTTDNMMRYANPGDTSGEVWQAKADVYDGNGNYSDSSTLDFSVESYSTITMSGSIEGSAQPTQTITNSTGGDTDWIRKDSIDAFEANFEWSISGSITSTISDGSGNELTGFSTTYNSSSGNPTDFVSDTASTPGPGAIPTYEITVDSGSPPGDYSGTLTHEITINET